MALQGTVDAFGLEGIFRLLEWSGASGVLHVDSEGRTATAWVGGGSCLWAETELHRDALDPPEALLDAVFELCLARTGVFRFHPCEPAELRPPRSAPRKIRDLLKEVAERRSGWPGTLRELPGLDVVVELVPGDPPGDVVIRPAEWRLLARIQGGKTVRQLLRSGEGLWRTGNVLTSLLRSGLVRVAEEPAGGERAPRAPRPAPELVEEIAALAGAGELAPQDPGPPGGAQEAPPGPAGPGVEGSPEEGGEGEGVDMRRLARQVLRDLSAEGAGEGGDPVPAPGAAAGERGGRSRARFLRLLSGDH